MAKVPAVAPSFKAFTFGIVSLFALPALAEPRADVRRQADDLTRSLEANADAKKVAQAEIKKARGALDRADKAHKGGDHTHAAVLEAIALEWAEAASELSRAAKAEKAASDLEQKLSDTESKIVRAQALLEQTAARRARAASQLEELEPKLGKQSPAPTDGKAPKAEKKSVQPKAPAEPKAPKSEKKP